jgi:hypothetical protein
VTSEYVYCYQTQTGIRLAKQGDFEASYFLSDPINSITIAHFVMVERWSDLQKYSLLSIGDRSRRLYFDARSGFQGEYQEIMNSDLPRLQRSIALKVNDIRYLQPANAGLSIPIVNFPFAVFKLAIHIFIIYYSIKLGSLLSRLIQSHTLEQRRRDAGLCPHCAYDCTDLPSSICPECGEAYL